MGQPRRSFTPEFKQEAVDLCRRSGKSACQVARELGIPQPTFNRWMQQAAKVLVNTGPKGTAMSFWFLPCPTGAWLVRRRQTVIDWPAPTTCR
jgi:hypothetical protein